MLELYIDLLDVFESCMVELSQFCMLHGRTINKPKELGTHLLARKFHAEGIFTILCVYRVIIAKITPSKVCTMHL